jgi:hypothetical protein
LAKYKNAEKIDYFQLPSNPIGNLKLEISRIFHASYEINTAVSGRDFLIHKRMEDLLWGIILCLKKFSREVQKLKCDP